ncbi:glycosyltransferase family 2 protein [Gracilibacillus massiliensis]|uniref:glycosyltransferase family 2 protein n=1 Tax=Gracilibacillus massiliensis TaxID=1564956 RepID=UPI00071D4881|nr:glycosyltransferase [Gracilibacillus massiliensis]
MLELLMIFFGGMILLYMVLTILTYLFMLWKASVELKKQYQLDKQELDEDYIHDLFTKPVSIIVPAYNEEAGIVDNVHALLNLHYPQTELLVVNDGSTDSTQTKLVKQFKMKQVHRVIREQIDTKKIIAVYQSTIYPHLWLVEKENGGKADALNVGINMAKCPYFCSIDGDSLLDDKSLLRVMKPINMSNDQVVAAGGNVRIANDFDIRLGAIYKFQLSKNPLIVMQIVEYLRAFMMGRIALSKYNLILIISGAFSVFSKEWVIRAGGYSTNIIGEDMELVVKLHRLLKEQKQNKRIEFVPDPVCWTEAPTKLSVLRKQRRRWSQGLLESLWKHKKMTFNPKYRQIGMISFPYFWIVECLGPIIELGGYMYVIVAFFLGDIYFEFALLLALLFILYGSILSALSVLLEAWMVNTYPRFRDVLRMVFVSLTEVFWYRPLTLIWRVEGFIRFLLRKKDWGNMQRTGLAKKGYKQ